MQQKVNTIHWKSIPHIYNTNDEVCSLLYVKYLPGTSDLCIR